MHRIMKVIRIKKSKKISRKDDQVRELRLLKMPVIFSKYLINKITYIDLDMQIQRVRTLNECIRIKGKVHVHVMGEHIVIQL